MAGAGLHPSCALGACTSMQSQGVLFSRRVLPQHPCHMGLTQPAKVVDSSLLLSHPRAARPVFGPHRRCVVGFSVLDGVSYQSCFESGETADLVAGAD